MMNGWIKKFCENELIVGDVSFGKPVANNEFLWQLHSDQNNYAYSEQRASYITCSILEHYKLMCWEG